MDTLKGWIILTLALAPFVGLATAVDVMRFGEPTAASIVGGLCGGILFWGIVGLAWTHRRVRGRPQQSPNVRLGTQETDP